MTGHRRPVLLLQINLSLIATHGNGVTPKGSEKVCGAVGPYFRVLPLADVFLFTCMNSAWYKWLARRFTIKVRSQIPNYPEGYELHYIPLPQVE